MPLHKTAESKNKNIFAPHATDEQSGVPWFINNRHCRKYCRKMVSPRAKERVGISDMPIIIKKIITVNC